MFLHGFPEGAFIWDELLTHFARPEHGGYRCIAPNLRGFERSSAPSDAKAYRAKYLLQDIAALIQTEGGSLECLVAHDWGGAVAWSLANQLPQLLRKLVIINSPHPGTFLRELQGNPKQQAASAYMNFLVRADAQDLLAQDDYRRLWQFFTGLSPAQGEPSWLSDALKQQYRELWCQGLRGGCNYYRATPLRPARVDDPAAAAITLAQGALNIAVTTLVIWGLNDAALRPELIDGLHAYVPDLRLRTVRDASHWIVHEQPELVIECVQGFLLPKGASVQGL